MQVLYDSAWNKKAWRARKPRLRARASLAHRRSSGTPVSRIKNAPPLSSLPLQCCRGQSVTRAAVSRHCSEQLSHKPLCDEAVWPHRRSALCHICHIIHALADRPARRASSWWSTAPAGARHTASGGSCTSQESARGRRPARVAQ
eukprot:5462639-Prymnesium_polylepis.1